MSIEYLKRGDISPFPADRTLKDRHRVAHTDRGDLHGDFYWSESQDTGWIVAYDSRYDHWAYVGSHDFDVDKCC